MFNFRIKINLIYVLITGIIFFNGLAFAATGYGLSNIFTIDNRNSTIIETQFNRIPAVIPQHSFFNPARSTMPLKFAGEFLPDGTAPIDLGPLSVTARIQNPSQSNIKVKLKIKEYIDPAGNTHTKLFNGSYSESTYYRTIEPMSSSDLSVYVTPPSNDIGTWQVNLDLYQRKGATSLSDEKIATVPLTFTVKNPDEPTVSYPDFSNDALGNVLSPPEQITLTNTVWDVTYKTINALKFFCPDEIRGSVGASYTDYYEGLTELLGNIRRSAILKVKPKTIGSDIEYNITWYHSISQPYNLGMDRAVILAYIPDGIASSDLINSGSAHVLESQGQIKGLMWLINGADKRIWQTSGNRCEWIPRDLSFKFRADSVKGKKIQFLLQLQIGPFANASPNYQYLKDAPWVYDYNKWLTNPQDVCWYDIAVTDPVTIIDDSHQLAINRSLDYFLISDAGSIFLPYECTPTPTPSQETIVSWSDALPPPSIPSGFGLVSAIRMFGADPSVTLDKPATITLPFEYSGSEFEQLGIFRWEASISNWLAITTEINVAESLASAKITEPGIYAVLDSGVSLPPVPEVSLEFPVDGMAIQQHTPEFTWNDPIGDGWLYQVQVDDTPDFSSLVADEICTEPNIVLGQWLGEKTYYWRVRRLDQSGTVSQWTSAALFTITPDATPPVVLGVQPTNNAEITEGLPIISIHIVDNETAIDQTSITMTIDSNIVDCQYDIFQGTISYTPPVPLTPGGHTVNLVVVDVNGNETNVSWSFIISRYMNVKAKPFKGGIATPGGIIHVIDSNEMLIECESYSGYKFLNWSIQPEDTGIIETPYSLVTLVNLFGNATVAANFTRMEDFTSNGKVNFEDFAVFCRYWLKDDCVAPFWCDGIDLNQDGDVNIEDITIFVDEWLYNAELDILNLIDFAELANWWGAGSCESQNDCNGADLNFDGVVDLHDLLILSNNWL